MTIKEMDERKKKIESQNEEALKELEQAQEFMDEYVYDWENDSSVRETIAYGAKRQGTYTVDDYYVLSEDERLELIDGVLYNMSSPTAIHQVIAGKVYYKLENYIMGKKGPCIPIISPIDVQLDCDEKTILQPDVIIVCDRDKLKKGIVYGAPDFVVEVLSPSTRKRDKNLKLNKYICAGVREYWIVDPEKKNIVVYAEDGQGDYDIFVYTFENEVPVRIFNEECKINFKEIYEYIAFMYEK